MRLPCPAHHQTRAGPAPGRRQALEVETQHAKGRLRISKRRRKFVHHFIENKERIAELRSRRFNRVGSNLLFYSTEERTHQGAVAACAEFESHLVEFLSESEWQEVKLRHKVDLLFFFILSFQITAALGEVHATRYWIGLTDLFSEGDFFWGQSGTQISPEVRAHWGRGEPNNHGEGEDCVEVRADADGSNAHMNDQGCGDQATYVCQYRLT